MSPQNQSSSEFGANEWIVEEMWQAYQTDPKSVSPQWREYFATNPAPAAPPSATSSPAQALTPKVTVIPGKGAAPHRRAMGSQDVSRSDLPPAPAANVQPPSSAYIERATSEHTHGASGEPCTDSDVRMKGPAARTAKNMDQSLSIPTATSTRAIPAKVMIENRSIINHHLASTRGGKVSFTHLIAWATIEALSEMPQMNVSYTVDDAGKPVLHNSAHVAFGLAIDVPQKNGDRQLLVPNVKQADLLDLNSFISAYEDLVARARQGKLTVDDFQGTTITLTNPGMIGTLSSVPRLMPGQGVIVGVGAMNYPAAFAGASEETLARQGIGKVITLSSTYDHRVIQGALSGAFLRLIEQKLLGLDGFWDRAFEALRIPNEPVAWSRDTTYDAELETGKPARVAELIHAFRQHGHLTADTDPLAYRLRRHPDLSLSTYGLSLWDLDRRFPSDGLGGSSRATLREILEALHYAYSRTVGVEYMHIQDPRQRQWWQERIENTPAEISQQERFRILTKLGQAEAFESFLQTKYVGQKRFSLEGGESLIVLLDRLLDAAAHDGLDEVVIGMAHRGRLNVLANIAGKSYGQIFGEFEGTALPTGAGTGDVKYHQGTEGIFTGSDGVSIRVSLAANPSHLETVDGVVEGIVRAKQDRIGLGEKGYTVLPVLIHGDAAFAGQGVVYETLNMSQLDAYHTGGTIHVIVNNQIGFTTGAGRARSTRYCTDLAKGLQVPIFHINADDPEAVANVIRNVYDYRATFHKDVIIDLVCYRRRGHNEGDDPSMTQPVMYQLIDSLASTREVYTASLVGRGDISLADAQQISADFKAELERILTDTREADAAASPAESSSPAFTATDPNDPMLVGVSRSALEMPHSQMAGEGMMIGWTSAVGREVIERVGDAQIAIPEHFQVHPKLQTLLHKRQQMSREGKIDWGMGELLAFGSLLMEGTPIRIAGEDARRATFAQRHAVLHDYHTGAEWTPLNFLTPDQAPLHIYDSLLSEYAALAFEYGYSVERPEALSIWEAQFGDFANGAQTVIDEFISSASQKWGQRSGLVMLLPHGFEGQGPDHSSARVERYLQLCAQDNMRVVQPSTPANYFHLLREQAYLRPRRPLIVMTPKQLLRLKAASSSVEDFTRGVFQTVIPEVSQEVVNTAVSAPDAASGVSRVLMCSGRVYYDLLAHRQSTGDNQTAIVRLEQLYPLDDEALAAALAPFRGAELVWVQDEPENQGPWPWLATHFPRELAGGITPRVISRPEAAAPAVGTAKEHKRQQQWLIDTAFSRN